MSNVTVIIPVYNGAAYLNQAIESALGQTMPATEVIVIADGSTDDTPYVVSHFDSRLQYIRQGNQGLAAARNAGIKVSHGKYLAFLDADDFWAPSFLKTMANVLENSSPRVGIVACGWQYVDHLGLPVGETRCPPHSITMDRLAVTNLFPIHAALVKRDCLYRTSLFDTNLTALEDWDLWIRIMLADCQIITMRSVLAKYRILPNSMSRDITRMTHNRLMVLDKLFTHPDLSHTVKSQRPRAYASAYLDRGVGFFAMRNDDRGIEDVYRAIDYDPGILRELDFYYALACIEQPVPYKGSGQLLNLARSEKKLFEILEKVIDDKHFPDSLRKRIISNGYFTLARLSYAQNQFSLAWRYCNEAISITPGLIKEPDVLGLMLRLAAGPSFLSFLQKLRRQIF